MNIVYEDTKTLQIITVSEAKEKLKNTSFDNLILPNDSNDNTKGVLIYEYPNMVFCKLNI